MSGIEVFLDDTPGETRGIIARDGRFEHLIIQREDETPQHRLGARSVGRVASIEPGLGAAFVDLGSGAPFGFLPMGKQRLTEGERLTVEVAAEPRESKGPTLKFIGAGQGEPRLVQPGPGVPAILAALAPGEPVQTGVTAIQAAWDSEEEALADGDLFSECGLDLAVQRTRALIAVDIDYAPAPGRDAAKGKARANLEGLRQAARLIRLKNWGGLIAIDLIGSRLDGESLSRAARAAFDDPQLALGPISRFGTLQLSMPWRRRPVDEVLNAQDARIRAISVARHLRHALLSDPATPRYAARCASVDAELAAPLVARLGPRAYIKADPGLAPGRFDIVEG